MRTRGVTQKLPLLPTWSAFTYNKHSQAERHPARHRGQPLPSAQQLARVQQQPHPGPGSATPPHARADMRAHTCTRVCAILSSQCRQKAARSPFIPRAAILPVGISPSPPDMVLHRSAKPRRVFLLAETSASRRRVFFQLGLHLFCLFSMFLLFTQILFFPFPLSHWPQSPDISRLSQGKKLLSSRNKTNKVIGKDKK